MDEHQISAAFKKRTGYVFKNRELLTQALTHSSRAIAVNQHNERLEFLGDRVLALAIAEALYERFPNTPEGEMALRLNAMVRKEACAQVARKLKLGELMQSVKSGKGPKHDVFTSKNVLGDACEAVLAAIYLDGGFIAARDFVLDWWSDMIFTDTEAKKDPKSALQEWALARGFATPIYTEISRQGPDHAPSFVMSVEIAEKGKKRGEGATKRAAEQTAAAAFMKKRRIKF